MKTRKFFTIFCCVLLAVILLTALSLPQGKRDGQVTFYYPAEEYSYGSPQGVMGSEAREVGSHQTDLTYLLDLYLQGPISQNLAPAFPSSAITKVQSVKMAGSSLVITLSDLDSAMSEGQFSLACACLTKTCLGFTNARAVQIHSGERSVRMTPSNLVLFDESTSVIQPGGEEEK